MKGVNLGESVRNRVWVFAWGFVDENAYESVDHSDYIFVHGFIDKFDFTIIKTIRDGTKNEIGK